jgi:hypothetical protein
MTPVSAESCPLPAALRVLKFPLDPQISTTTTTTLCLKPDTTPVPGPGGLSALVPAWCQVSGKNINININPDVAPTRFDEPRPAGSAYLQRALRERAYIWVVVGSRHNRTAR